MEAEKQTNRTTQHTLYFLPPGRRGDKPAGDSDERLLSSSGPFMARTGREDSSEKNLNSSRPEEERRRCIHRKIGTTMCHRVEEE